MAENIDKTYPKGIWGKDNLHERYEHVLKKVKLFVDGEDDEHDLRWNIKNAVLNNIYISEEALKTLGEVDTEARCFRFRKNGTMDDRLKEIYSELLKTGYVDFHTTDICRFRNGKVVTYEHVIPWEVFGNEVVALYKAGKFTEEAFENIRKKVNVCLVTKAEDARLSKGMKQSMPADSDWLNVEGDEFARYKKAGIKIYKKEF